MRRREIIIEGKLSMAASCGPVGVGEGRYVAAAARRERQGAHGHRARLEVMKSIGGDEGHRNGGGAIAAARAMRDSMSSPLGCLAAKLRGRRRAASISMVEAACPE